MKRFLIFKTFSLITILLALTLANVNAAVPPTISSFSPQSGPIGTTVTITGTNFNTTPGNNIVFFGAVKAVVTAATATSLTVTVPAGTTYQPVSVTDFTTGLTAYSTKPFAITFPGSNAFDSFSFSYSGPAAESGPWGVFNYRY